MDCGMDCGANGANRTNGGGRIEKEVSVILCLMYVLTYVVMYVIFCPFGLVGYSVRLVSERSWVQIPKWARGCEIGCEIGVVWVVKW